MGDERLSVAVADAGPLIHLAEIGCLFLLSVFDSLQIPEAVWGETVGQSRVSEQGLLSSTTIQRQVLDGSLLVRFIQDNSLEFLQAGEQESLFLCYQLNMPLVLTDDLAVREASKLLHLTPVGSLGIVVKAHKLAHISLQDAEHHILNLYDVSSLYVTRAIVELAIEQLSGSV